MSAKVRKKAKKAQTTKAREGRSVTLEVTATAGLMPLRYRVLHLGDTLALTHDLNLEIDGKQVRTGKTHTFHIKVVAFDAPDDDLVVGR